MFSTSSCGRLRSLMCFSIVSRLDVSTITLSGFQRVTEGQNLAQLGVILGRILGHVRFERDSRPLEEDHLVRPIAIGRVAIVRVVEAGEIGRHAHRVPAGLDILSTSRVPDALLTLSVGPVMVEVAELPEQRALADAGPTDNRDAHGRSILPEDTR